MTKIVRYVGGSPNGRGLELGELSKPYYFNPEGGFVQDLDPRDEEWFVTAPFSDYVIEEGTSSSPDPLVIPSAPAAGATGRRR